MSLRAVVLAFAVMAVATPASLASAQGATMPDPRQMSGIPLPVADVPSGTVTVRVVRGSLSNVVQDHPVELLGPATTLKADTSGNGRAEFQGIAPGTRLRARTVVNGERLESQEFEMPVSGGIRLMLVAAGGESVTPADAAPTGVQPGSVVFSDQSRFVFEFNDDGLSVFSILQVLNAAEAPVQPAEPLVFDLPDGAEGAAVLEGSSPQATLAGRRITVTGPFAPGTTLVQFAYSLEYSGDTLTVEQRLPAPLLQLAVLAQKVGDMHVASPQIARHREMPAQGQTYIVAQGPAMQAGDTLTLTFTGLPHSPVWPRNLALALAALVLAAGAWASLQGSHGPAAAESRRKKIEGRRDRLFAELTELEEQHRAGRVDKERYVERRRALVSALERVYAELDETAAA